jgi:APA family basic amino acid/polyamine antiporter
VPGPQRQLSLFDTASIIVGIIIGSGLYETTPLIASCLSGSGELALVWIAGGLFALVGSLCYAEMATAYPDQGGDYVYLTRAYGRPVGLLFAWTQLWVVRPGAMGALALIFARYASQLYNLGTYSYILYAALAVVSLAAVNILGVRQGTWLQNVLTIAKVLGLVGVIGLGFLAAGPTAAAVEPAPAAGPSDWRLALILVLWAYSGWNEMAFVAAEVRQPERNILRALLTGTLLIVTIYLAANAAFLHALGFAGLQHSQAVAADVVRPGLGAWGAQAMSVLVCISALGAMNGMTFTGARIYYALGREHAMFAALGRWSPRFGTPVRSLIVEGTITLSTVLVLSCYYLEQGSAFDRLVAFTAPLFWLFLGLSAAALVILRFRDPNRRATFAVPLYPLTPLLFIVGCGFMLYETIDYALFKRSWEAVWPLFVLVAGIVACFFDKRPAESSEQ